MRIKNKISLRFGISYLLLSIVLGVTTSIFSGKAFRALAEHSLESIVSLRTEQVKTFISDQKKLAMELVIDTELGNLLELSKGSGEYITALERERSRLIESQRVVPEVVELVVLDKFGKVILATGKTELGSDMSTNENFTKAQQNVYFRDFYYSETYKQYMYAVSAPIKNVSGGVLGVMVARFDSRDFYGILSEVVGLGSTGESFLVNKDYYFLTPSKYLGESVVLKQKAVTQNVKNCFSSEGKAKVSLPSVQNYVDYRGVKIVGTHEYIPETGWCLIGKIDSDEVYAPLWQQGLIFGGMALLATVLFLGAGWLISKSISEPIEKLSRGMEIVGGGDLNYKFENIGDDEIGLLTRSFIKMVELINASRVRADIQIETQKKSLAVSESRMEDQQKAIINVLEDVELEKKISEKQALDLLKFRQAVENANDHMVITDPDAIVLYANKAVSRITGFSADEVVGKKAGAPNLWGGLMPKEFYEKMWHQLKEDKLTFTGEITNKRKNGEKYTALVSISPIVDKDGKVSFFVGVERDITKEKEVDRMKTEFVSLVTHQLRSPITAMKWGIEMMLTGDGGELSQGQKEILENVNESNNHMNDLVGSLLNISRIESGRIMIEPVKTVLSELVRHILVELVPQTTERKVTVQVNSTFDEPVEVDPKLTLEVYKNLLTNAIKYSRAGGIVKVEIYKDSGEVVSKVTDSGYGIPDSEQVHIFQKFYRASNITKEVPEGTGLGLYLTKQIVEASGGKIGFESKDGEGTAFWFSVPATGVLAKKGEVGLT